MTLPSLYIFQVLLYIKENYINQTFRGNIHNYDTRSKEQIDIFFTRLSKVQKHYKYICIHLFNLFPPRAASVSFNRFKF